MLKDRQGLFTSGATPERPRLEGVIPFQARVHLPWERLPGRTPRCVMGVIPFTRAPSPRPAKQILLTPKNPNSWFLRGRGHHIPAPTWEGCRATLSVFLSCSALPAGGCRSSGWALVLLAVALLALVLFARLWVWGFFFVSLRVGPDPRTGFLPQGFPLDVLGLWLPARQTALAGSSRSSHRGASDGSIHQGVSTFPGSVEVTRHEKSTLIKWLLPACLGEKIRAEPIKWLLPACLAHLGRVTTSKS